MKSNSISIFNYLGTAALSFHQECFSVAGGSRNFSTGEIDWGTRQQMFPLMPLVQCSLKTNKQESIQSLVNLTDGSIILSKMVYEISVNNGTFRDILKTREFSPKVYGTFYRLIRLSKCDLDMVLFGRVLGLKLSSNREL